MGELKDLYAYVAVNPMDQSESLIVAGFGAHMIQLVGDDIERLRFLAPLAAMVSFETGKMVHMVRFKREEVYHVVPIE